MAAANRFARLKENIKSQYKQGNVPKSEYKPPPTKHVDPLPPHKRKTQKRPERPQQEQRPAPARQQTPPPREPTPREPTPREPTPREPTPREPTPREPTPREPTPREPTPREPTPREPTPRQPTPEPEPTPPREPTPPPPQEVIPPPFVPAPIPIVSQREPEHRPKPPPPNRENYDNTWNNQTGDRMSSHKIQASIQALLAANRFKQMLMLKRERLRTPQFENQALPYIGDKGPPPEWKTMEERAARWWDVHQSLENWRESMAKKFLERSWGDPYFAQMIGKHHEKAIKKNDRNIALVTKEIDTIYQENAALHNFITFLENQNKKLLHHQVQKENPGTTYYPAKKGVSAIPRDTYLGKRANLLEDLYYLKKKQQHDANVLERLRKQQMSNPYNDPELEEKMRTVRQVIRHQAEAINDIDHMLYSKSHQDQLEFDEMIASYNKDVQKVNQILGPPNNDLYQRIHPPRAPEAPNHNSRRLPKDTNVARQYYNAMRNEEKYPHGLRKLQPTTFYQEPYFTEREAGHYKAPKESRKYDNAAVEKFRREAEMIRDKYDY